MMNKVYDNNEKLIGCVKDIKDYINEHKDFMVYVLNQEYVTDSEIKTIQ